MSVSSSYCSFSRSNVSDGNSLTSDSESNMPLFRPTQGPPSACDTLIKKLSSSLIGKGGSLLLSGTYIISDNAASVNPENWKYIAGGIFVGVGLVETAIGSLLITYEHSKAKQR